MRCRPNVPLSWPQEVRELIQRCWHADAYSRPAMAQVHSALSDFQATLAPVRT